MVVVMDKIDIEYEAWSDMILKDISKYMPHLAVKEKIMTLKNQGLSNLSIGTRLGIHRTTISAKLCEGVVIDIELPEGIGLGKLCRNGHVYENTGKCLRRDEGRGKCLKCISNSNKRYLKGKREKKMAEIWQKDILIMSDRDQR